METIEFDGTLYPKFQSDGNAARFIIPFAKEVCKGVGFDIGFNIDEWKFPGSYGIDVKYNNGYWHATNLPDYNATTEHCSDVYLKKEDYIFEKDIFSDVVDLELVDYIFSSHCLEHLDDWVLTMDYWLDKVCSGGIIFLYLPDYSQRYWRPWNNRKHKSIFTKEILSDYCEDNRDRIKNFMISGVDLNNSFSCVIERV